MAAYVNFKSYLEKSCANLFWVLQGTTGPDPCTVYVDMKSLRHDRRVMETVFINNDVRKASQ